MKSISIGLKGCAYNPSYNPECVWFPNEVNHACYFVDNILLDKVGIMHLWFRKAKCLKFLWIRLTHKLLRAETDPCFWQISWRHLYHTDAGFYQPSDSSCVWTKRYLKLSIFPGQAKWLLWVAPYINIQETAQETEYLTPLNSLKTLQGCLQMERLVL